MVEIAANDLLADELAMRGGTCLHKLHLPQPLRYSEDLDYVRRSHSGMGPYMEELRTIATTAGLVEHGYEQAGQMVHMTFDAEATSGMRRIRIKIETNIRETEACFERITRRFQVVSDWWSGAAEITTFHVEELMGTKLRALYQRSKGRDLFDLWYVLTETHADAERVIRALNHYMRSDTFTYAEFATNLRDKLADPDFTSDINDLVATKPVGYDPISAADLIIERLGSRLVKAPPADRILNGQWRTESART